MKKYFALMALAIFSFFVTSAKAESEPVFNLTHEGLQKAIAARQAQSGLVGIGALVMVDGKIIAQAVAGERKKGSGVAVTAQDQWHLGSITKSMTATLIGILVEEDVLAWDMTLPQMLPDMAMDEGWHKARLQHLLTHSAGLPANFPMRTQFNRPQDREALHTARRDALAAILAKPPKYDPGETFLYSNVGFTLAGFIAAERMNQSWETLMEERLFAPLGLGSAGFGPPRGDALMDQPWGHSKFMFTKMAKTPLSDGADNTPIMAPAGTVHMTMADLATFGHEHLKGEKGDSNLLSATTFKHLHTPSQENYAAGLVVVQRDWAQGRLIWHNGSNTMWYALLLVLPEKNTVMVFVTNDGDRSTADAIFKDLAVRIVRAL